VKAGGRTQAQQLESQTSYYSVNDLRLHFGLGPAEKADAVEIRWPNGGIETIRDVPANRVIYVKEGAGII
jgi:hypothetical protein